MRIYSRILGYAGPLWPCAFYYFSAILLSIVFGLATYGLVIPLLKVLFNQEELRPVIMGRPGNAQMAAKHPLPYNLI
ncbi:MAG: hypothetical protein QWI37_04245 [Candidatus Cardinium sp.]|nr:hypothetical protein [Candidatus Cardinium sp.]